MKRPRSYRSAIWPLALTMLLSIAPGQHLSSNTPRFYDDDPLSREPETQDASGATELEIDLFFDLALNLFVRPGQSGDFKAQNVNTIDEVPDSSWFTNRIGSRPLSLEELARGPNTTQGPSEGRWIISAAKTSGVAPGFTVRDERGETWFVSFDAKGRPEAATAAVVVASKIFWALGYFQVESHLTHLREDQLVIGETAVVTPPSGQRRPMKAIDIKRVLSRAHQSADGSYRAIAGRALPGKVLGGFKYYGTRPDDPNDVVPHEHRRELRALQVFGAWTNLVDMKAGNTVDVLLPDKDRSIVRHYLQDVGSTFGTGALAPRDWDEGYEYLYEGDKVWKRFVSLGFFFQPWQTIPYEDHEAIGRFEGDRFDPEAWRTRVPAAAVRNARADDTFWAARRVMAFTDEHIRHIVKTGEYSDPSAENHLADVLIRRRDRIGQAYLPKVNPLVGFELGPDGTLTFANVAVRAAVASPPAGGYRLEWSAFDNATGATRSMGSGTSSQEQVSGPAELATAGTEFVKVSVHAVDSQQQSWARPVHAYFRRAGGGWKLVGLERD